MKCEILLATRSINGSAGVIDIKLINQLFCHAWSLIYQSFLILFSAHMVKVSIQEGPYLQWKPIIAINMNYKFQTIYHSEYRGN